MVTEKRILTEISLMNDAAFKAFFRSRKARGLVSTFLSEVTGISKEKFMEAEFVGGELPKQIITEKGKTADVLIILNNRQFVILEANTSLTNTLLQKNLSYATSVYSEATRIKETEYPRVTLVNMDLFNRHHTTDAIIEYQMQDKKERYYLRDSLIIYDIVLENLKLPGYTNIVLKKFGTFLTTESLKELEQLSRGDKEYMDAFQKIEDLARDEDFIGYYDYEERRKWEEDSLKREMKEEGRAEGRAEGFAEGRFEGLAEGRAKGLGEGRAEAQKEIIQKMHKNGMSSSDIAKLLEVDKGDIEKILE